MTSAKLRRPAGSGLLSVPRLFSGRLGAGHSAGVLRLGATVAGLGLAAIIAGWLIANGQTKVVAAFLVPIPVLLFVRAAPIAAVLVLVVMNGVPVVNLGGRVGGGIRVQDVGVIALAVLLYAYKDRHPSARMARYLRVARTWSAIFVAFWAFTVVRSALLDSIPWRDAFVYGRDFMYFALLLPLALNARFSANSLRIAGLVLLSGGTIYAFGQMVASATGRVLVSLVHPVHVGNTVGLARFFSPMNYLLETCLMFAAALFLTKTLPRYRPVLGAVVLILAGAALLGLTRANYLGILVAALACLVVYTRRHGSITGLLVRGTVAVLLVGTVLILFTAIAGHSGSLSSNPVIGRVQTGVSDLSKSTGTFAYRKKLDTQMIGVLGAQWPIGLGFLYPTVHPVQGLPLGAIRNSDTGVLNIIMTMGLIGTVLIYAPLVYLIRELLRVSRRARDGTGALPPWILYGATAWFGWALASSLTLGLLFSVPGVVLAAIVLAALARAFVETTSAPEVDDGVRVPASPSAPPTTQAAVATRWRKAMNGRDPLVNGWEPLPAAAVHSAVRPPEGFTASAVHSAVTHPEPLAAHALAPAVIEPEQSLKGGPQLPTVGDTQVARQLSVVIVTDSAGRYVGRCIKALRAVLRDCEIIVVENVSRAESLSRGRSSDTRAKVVSIEASAGFGAACNLGVVTASNEHVLVMTEDVVVEEADLGRLASSFAEHDFGLFTPSLRREGDGPAQQQVVAQSSWWTELKALALGPLQPRDPLQSANAAENVSAAWVTGVLMLVRREEFCAIGGFDERFLLYYEHRELSARYQQVGMPIGATDAVKAVYSGGQSVAEDGEPAVDPMAWSVLAWLEFVALEYGQRRARLSWAAIRATHRIGERFARWGATLGARRLRGTARHLSAVDADLNRICDAGDGARQQSYPVACQVINGVSNGHKR